MIKLWDYLETTGVTDVIQKDDIARFLIARNWFGKQHEVRDNEVWVDEAFNAPEITKALNTFKDGYGLSLEQKNEMLKESLPHDTKELWAKYAIIAQPDELIQFMVLDFLNVYLAGELPTCDDKEVQNLLNDAVDVLRRQYAVVLTEFVNWVRANTKTMYRQEYEIPQYADYSDTCGSYSKSEYLRMMYYLFNDDYITDNQMYSNAAESQKYADTWLYLCLHFICSLRDTDLERIIHPRLTMPPETVLKQIRDGTFSEITAKDTSNMLVDELSALRLAPHKTLGTTGVGSIKLFIPESLSVHFGILFACAEAHHQLSGASPNDPLIKTNYTSHRSISRNMGDEIGDLFLEFDFRCRSANKSYLQTIADLADDVLQMDIDGNIDKGRANSNLGHVKGYILAALARTHKSGFADFATTTVTYLNGSNAKAQAAFVIRELFERGVLSSISSMLLEMLLGKQSFNALTEPQKTTLTQALDLTPLEVDNIVGICNATISNAKALAQDIYAASDQESIIKILHHIGNGDAASKQPSCMCVLTAMGKTCPFNDRQTCIMCPYEVSTSATLRLLARESVRLTNEYKQSKQRSDHAAANKYKTLFATIVAPSIERLLACARTLYDAEIVNLFKKTVEDEINATGNQN